MKLFLGLTALALVCCAANGLHSAAKVQVYSRNPGEYGAENTLICHVSEFHPPNIEIKLMKDDVEIPGAKQTDLAFGKDWRFQLTKNVPFTPKQGERYSCHVTHGGRSSSYSWEPNM